MIFSYIKTINNTSLLGSGNIAISSGSTYSAGTGINIDSNNVISNTITDYNDLTGLPTIPTKTSELTNDSGYITNNYQIFSTTETRIGTWINNKPLYRKVVHLGTLPAGAYYNLIPSGITNMGVMVALYGGAMSASNNGFPLPYLGATSSGGNIELVYLSNGDIRVWCTKDYSALDGYVVIEYTKSKPNFFTSTIY